MSDRVSQLLYEGMSPPSLQFSWNHVMAPHPDAVLHIWPSSPPPGRSPGEPLRVALNLEAWGLDGKQPDGHPLFDLGVTPYVESDVQLTYQGVQHTLQAGRQQTLAKFKRQVGAGYLSPA